MRYSVFRFGDRGDRLDLILPVGISFYTFQTMSYTIDVFKGKIMVILMVLGFICSFCKFFSSVSCWAYRKSFKLITTV